MKTIYEGISELVVGPHSNDATTLETIEDAALVVEDGRVLWQGPRGELAETLSPPADASGSGAAMRHDLGGRAVIPGLVDCHTHLVYAGDRTRDFYDRCCGVSYEEVAARGGGIQTTVDATREASAEVLVDLAEERCRDLAVHGVTTIEVKSGYGLSLEAELKVLQVVAALRKRVPQRIVATCLAAHVVPREHRSDRGAYVRMVCEQLLPRVRADRLATFVDVYCDSGAFTLAETRTIFEAASKLGFGLKVHAGQLSRTGAASLAAEMGAVSADHLEHIDARDARALAQAGTVADVLPGAGIFLGGKTKPPIEALRDAGATIALSTDLNPGTSPTAHLPLMATLGCTWLAMTPAETLLGITANAARALDLKDGAGTLAVGAPADFAVLRWPTWRQLPYQMAATGIHQTYVAGVCIQGGD